MKARNLVDRIDWVGFTDWDRKIFDNLIPLPDGTTYNAWLVRGSGGTALVDTVDPLYTDVLIERIRSTGVRRLDYVVANHLEQDHSGSLPRILELHPEAVLLATEKGKGLAQDLLHVSPDRIKAVADGEKVDLGGLTLQFIHFPWVHWPETMLTFVPERKTLLPGDLFGSHLAQSDLYATDSALVYRSAKRYFAEIMMPFRQTIANNLAKVVALAPDFIGPSHGPAHNRPGLIIDAYREWTQGKTKDHVLIPYISMHDSTKILVRRLVDSLAAQGVTVEQFDLADDDTGKLAMGLVDASTIVIGTPMVLGGAHPKAAYAAFLANALRPPARFISVVGSFGWGGKAVDQLVSMMPNIKAEAIAPVMIKGLPKEADLEAVDRLAAAIVEKHRTINVR